MPAAIVAGLRWERAQSCTSLSDMHVDYFLIAPLAADPNLHTHGDEGKICADTADSHAGVRAAGSLEYFIDPVIKATSGIGGLSSVAFSRSFPQESAEGNL